MSVKVFVSLRLDVKRNLVPFVFNEEKNMSSRHYCRNLMRTYTLFFGYLSPPKFMDGIDGGNKIMLTIIPILSSFLEKGLES